MLARFDTLNTGNVALGTASWTRILDPNQLRKFLFLRQGSLGAPDVRIDSPDGDNPWCLTMDGAADFLTLNGMLANTAWMAAATGSIRARIKVTASTGDKCIFSISDASKNAYLAFTVDADEKLHAKLRIAAGIKWEITCTTALTAGKWYDVALVQNGTAPVLYIDRAVWPQSFSTSTDKTKWIPDVADTDSVQIGGNLYDSGAGSAEADYFKGSISDVHVFRGIEVKLSDRVLVGEWLFTEGTGVSAADTSGNAYTGTLAFATEWGSKNLGLLLGTGFTFDVSVPTGGIWSYSTTASVTVDFAEGY